jgi:hypothetical protein
MALTYNLPALDRAGRMDDPDRAGRWETPSDLGGLADSLKIGADRARLGEVKSIPDVWAQVQVFQQALLDTRHPTHLAAVSEWRGLLALLALQPEFSTIYELDLVQVDLTDSEGQARRFRRVLRDLRPMKALTGDGAWDSIGVLLFRERRQGAARFAAGKPTPLGILSPQVLVAAGKSAEQLACAGVPWMTAGLSDPTEARLSDRHLQILAEYAESLIASLREMAPQLDHDLYAALVALLSEFQDDCAEKVTSRAPLRAANIGLNWPAPLFQILEKTRILDATIIRGTTDCAIAVRPAVNDLSVKDLFEKGVILVDPTLAVTLGKSPEAITVWGRHSLAQAANPATYAEIVSEAEAEGWLVVRPDDFFTKELVRFDDATDIPAHGQSFRSALLPLSPLALLVMDPASLAEATELVHRGGEALVRLKLPMGGRARAVHTIERRLPSREDTEERPEDLAIWPNFSDPSWKWNFLHFQYNPKYELKPRFAVTADFIVAEILDVARAQSDRAARVRLWSDPERLSIETERFSGRHSQIKTSRGLLMNRLRFAEAEGNIGELHQLPRGVEAVFFARHDDDGFETPVGMALVRFTELTATAAKATVSVDFGTTNTVVYVDRGGDAKPMVFDERILFPFRVKSQEAERRDNLVEAYTSFFPLKQHLTPFPTVVKLREFLGKLDRDLQKRVDEGRLDDHAFADAIFFVPDFDNFAARQQQLTGENPYLLWTRTDILKFGLKWGETPFERALTARFLRQIMMMAAAELRAGGVRPGNIEWRFSYPQAFTASHRRTLEGALSDAWSTLFGEELGQPQAKFLVKSEGAAAAHYFMLGRGRNQVPAGNLMLMLDIGGGTTDIALWKGQKPCWRNSFRIAGGQFFTQYLANNPEILRMINLDDVAVGLRGDGDGGKRLSASAGLNFVELFVNKPDFTDRFKAGFPRFAATDEGAGLQYCASVALGGMMHYVGLVIQRLEALGEIKPVDLAHISVAFAGRGASLFRLFHDDGDPNSHLAQLIKIGIAAAGYDPEQVAIDILFSSPQEAKHEVAKGLLQVEKERTVGELKFAILGETLHVTGRGDELDLPIDADLSALQGVREFDDPDLAQIQAFLVALRRLTGIRVDLADRGGLRAIKNRLRTALSSELEKLTPDDFEDDAQPIEPPFIIALRELVTLMSLPVAERDRFVELTEKPR